MLKLKIFNYQTGTFQEQTLPPEPREYIIGRTSSCDIILDSPDISRAHGRITLQQNQYHYTDLGSANGSRLNNTELSANQNTPLKPEDLVSIGDFVLLVSEIDTSKQVSTADQPTSHGLLHGSSLSSSQSSLSLPSWSKGEITVRCDRITDETADVKTFTFTADPPVRFDYKPGQFVTLDLGSLTEHPLQINGESVSRSYSISSSPSRPYSLEITVKRVAAPSDQPNLPAGLVSNWLHDHLKVGHRLKLSGPLGKFTCATQPAAKLLLISAGSGITPMMSMSRWLADTATLQDTIFFHCARSPQDIIFRQELELMATRLPQFRLAISTTRPAPGVPWLGWTGRLDGGMLRAIAPDFQARTVYVCGPDSFMKGVKSLLEELGFPMQNYYQESFGAPKKIKSTVTALPQSPPVSSPVSTPSVASSASSLASSSASSSTSVKPSVCFTQSSKESAFEDVESILELAELEGIKIRSNCRQGICGACKKRKVEGEVRYESEPEALEPSEVAAGYILTCVAAPIGRVVLEA